MLTSERVFCNLTFSSLHEDSVKAAKYEIQKYSTCRATLFRCFPFFTLHDQLVQQQKHLLRVEGMQCADWLICLVWIKYGGICCVTSCDFDEKRATKPKFVAQSKPALYFSQQLFSTRNKCFCCGPS